MPAFIEIREVTKRFGDIVAVDNLSFTVAVGEIFGLVGSDGAGKSTLLRMIATMFPPASGEIIIDGLNAVTRRPEVKLLIGYMPQRFGLYQDLTVDENIEFFMDIFGIFGAERKKRKQRFLEFSNLLPFHDRLAGALSGGMKQKLGLACVLVHHPRILILDEPTNGVDPVSRRVFWDILLQMKKDGMTILISTAYLDEGERCDRLALMHASRIIASGPPETIRGDYPNLEEAIIHRIQDVDGRPANDNFKL